METSVETQRLSVAKTQYNFGLHASVEFFTGGANVNSQMISRRGLGGIAKFRNA